jgi:esterase/lipase superfamily enzyme
VNRHLSAISWLIVVVSVLPGCAHHKTTTMMPAPVIYHNSAIDPFAHLPSAQKTTTTKVFYATNRTPDSYLSERQYGNSIDSEIHLGVATIQMGDVTTDWSDLYEYSVAEKHAYSMPIKLKSATELTAIPTIFESGTDDLSPELQRFLASINKEITSAADKEIMIYVHGTKVDFDNSAILTAEIDHFAGRDFVGLAFAWPSHQNILAYLSGIDVRRALDSSQALQSLLILLAEHTNAEHINILSYSAGGKVTSKALFELRQSYAALSAKQLKEKFRIGAVVLAAIDVEVDVFLHRVPSISEIANQVVVTVTDNDHALKAARQFMGGDKRAGSAEVEDLEQEFIVSHQLANVEIIDVSLGQEIRGFDIEGHHYWYRHPWMSSDIVFLMRKDLPPAARGLTPAEMEGVWYLSPDYPEKIRDAAEAELKGQW